tara:strand:+ start:2965 stop:3171 length:207 start_codon:yes stop_codon:yes gene_type:complete
MGTSTTRKNGGRNFGTFLFVDRPRLAKTLRTLLLESFKELCGQVIDVDRKFPTQIIQQGSGNSLTSRW